MSNLKIKIRVVKLKKILKEYCCWLGNEFIIKGNNILRLNRFW